MFGNVENHKNTLDITWKQNNTNKTNSMNYCFDGRKSIYMNKCRGI